MQFEIIHKWVFLLLPLPFILFAILPALKRRRTALVAPFFFRAAELSDQKPRKNAWISKRNWLSWIVLFACWCCLIAAASGPQRVGMPAKKTKTVRSFMVVADISFSMAEKDWMLDNKRVTRWEAVKHLMQDFVEKRKSDQMGLILFGSNAYLQAPLTNDLNVVSWLLDQTEVGMAGQMTSIGQAIALGIKVFKDDTIKQKILLLMTDGIDSKEDILPLDVARQAKKDSITIFTLGIGKANTGGYELDEKTLKEIASVTGGSYFNAQDSKQLEGVYQKLNELQPVEYQTESYKPVELLYWYPLLACVILAIGFHLLIGLYRLFFA
jgi:Ca-activated chloride channel family protein